MASFTIPFSKIKRIDFMNTPSGMTGGQVYAKYKPDYLINGALYDMRSKKNIVYMEDENVKSGFLFSSKCIGIKGEKELVWVTKEEAYADPAIRDCLGGAPVLREHNRTRIDWGNKKSTQLLGSHFRSFIGYNKNYFYMCCSDNSITIEQAEAVTAKAGCEYSINLDGGGSCHLQKGSTVIKKSTRPNASWVLIFLEKQPKNEPQNEPVTNEKEEVGVSTPVKNEDETMKINGVAFYDKTVIPKGKKNVRTLEKMVPKYLVVHNTANTASGADDLSHAKYLQNLEDADKTYVSWHLTVDSDSCTKHLPFEEQGYHAGDGKGRGNTQGIGIEIAENKDYSKAEDNALNVICFLMKAYNITTDRVLPHRYFATSKKLCPRKILMSQATWQKDWSVFQKRIEERYKLLYKPTSGSGGAKEVTYQIEKGDTLSGISKKYGVDMITLAKKNKLSYPYRIYVGKKLTI